MSLDLLTANDTQGRYPASYYAATATPLAEFPKATGALRCDVCVVGGGFTGLSAAYHLATKGYDVVLLEAQRVGFGASGRNGGQVGTGQRVEMDALEKMVGDEPARALWDLSLESVQLVRDLIAAGDMDVPFHPGIIEAAHKPRMVPDYHAYAEAAHSIWAAGIFTRSATRLGWRNWRTMQACGSSKIPRLQRWRTADPRRSKPMQEPRLVRILLCLVAMATLVGSTAMSPNE